VTEQGLTGTLQFPPADADEFEPAGEDYWSFGKKHKFMLPDGKQWIEFIEMDEGARTLYQKATRTDLTLEKRTGDTRLRMDIGGQRYHLIDSSVTAWNMFRRKLNGGWEAVPFSKGSAGSTLAQWQARANPTIIDDLVKEINKANPWLMGEMSLDDMIKERDSLDELIEKKRRYEAGEGGSATR
jgi:hypothetical protein